MRILVILNSLTIGGAENYTVGLINQFANMGHNVTLIVLSNQLALKSRLTTDVKSVVLPRKYRLDISVLKKLRQEILSGEYDAIISKYIEYYKMAMLFTESTVTTIFPLHSTIPRSMKSHLLRKIIFKMKRRNEIYLTSIDSQTRYLLQTYNLRHDYFEQILNGIDTNYFGLCPMGFDRQMFLSHYGVSPDTHVILMIAGFREEKRHIDAINALNLLHASYPSVSLVCVGDDNLAFKLYLENHISKYNIKNVYLFSASEAGEVRNHYWACDMFTLTSDKVETFSISALEALSCGKPCVLTDIGGARDYISEMNNGCLVKPNNIESIKEGWLKILTKLDSFRSYEIREKVVQNYSIQTSAEKYIELIKRKKL